MGSCGCSCASVGTHHCGCLLPGVVIGVPCEVMIGVGDQNNEVGSGEHKIQYSYYGVMTSRTSI